jgi:hypothetical protein
MIEFLTNLGNLLLGVAPVVGGAILVGLVVNAFMTKR